MSQIILSHLPEGCVFFFDIDGHLVYSDSDGNFSIRLNRTSAPLRVALDSFVAPGQYQTLKASNECSMGVVAVVAVAREP